jgi:hypothetical protein
VGEAQLQEDKMVEEKINRQTSEVKELEVEVKDKE